jgi:hypothetical protein
MSLYPPNHLYSQIPFSGPSYSQVGYQYQQLPAPPSPVVHYLSNNTFPSVIVDVARSGAFQFHPLLVAANLSYTFNALLLFFQSVGCGGRIGSERGISCWNGLWVLRMSVMVGFLFYFPFFRTSPKVKRLPLPLRHSREYNIGLVYLCRG